MYTIHISRQLRNSDNHQNNGVNVSSLERRYSDFKRLDMSLRRQYGTVFMGSLSFPSRLIVGNFKPSTIAERSRAFEQYLTHIASIHVLCSSKEFSLFFCDMDIQRAYTMVRARDYLGAQAMFLSVVMLQQKLLTVHKQISNHPDLISNLSALTACYIATNNHKMAAITGEIAVQLLLCENGSQVANGYHSTYLVPLLKETVYSCWKLGKDKADLERHLNDLRSAGKVESKPVTLLELVQTKANDKF